MEKKYMVYALINEDTETVCETDTPKVAIRSWFSHQPSNPTNVAIVATSIENAKLLIDYAHSRKDVIEEFHGKYKNPYKLSFMLEAINKKHDDGCKGFCGYGDQIHPFDLG